MRQCNCFTIDPSIFYHGRMVVMISKMLYDRLPQFAAFARYRCYRNRNVALYGRFIARAWLRVDSPWFKDGSRERILSVDPNTDRLDLVLLTQDAQACNIDLTMARWSRKNVLELAKALSAMETIKNSNDMSDSYLKSVRHTCSTHYGLIECLIYRVS